MEELRATDTYNLSDEHFDSGLCQTIFESVLLHIVSNSMRVRTINLTPLTMNFVPH